MIDPTEREMFRYIGTAVVLENLPRIAHPETLERLDLSISTLGVRNR